MNLTNEQAEAMLANPSPIVKFAQNNRDKITISPKQTVEYSYEYEAINPKVGNETFIISEYHHKMSKHEAIKQFFDLLTQYKYPWGAALFETSKVYTIDGHGESVATNRKLIRVYKPDYSNDD